MSATADRTTDAAQRSQPAAPPPERATPASHRAAAYPGYSGDRPF